MCHAAAFLQPQTWIDLHPEDALGDQRQPGHRLCIAGNGIDAAILRAKDPTMPLPLQRNQIWWQVNVIRSLFQQIDSRAMVSLGSTLAMLGECTKMEPQSDHAIQSKWQLDPMISHGFFRISNLGSPVRSQIVGSLYSQIQLPGDPNSQWHQGLVNQQRSQQLTAKKRVGYVWLTPSPRKNPLHMGSARTPISFKDWTHQVHLPCAATDPQDLWAVSRHSWRHGGSPCSLQNI